MAHNIGDNTSGSASPCLPCCELWPAWWCQSVADAWLWYSVIKMANIECQRHISTWPRHVDDAPIRMWHHALLEWAYSAEVGWRVGITGLPQYSALLHQNWPWCEQCWRVNPLPFQKQYVSCSSDALIHRLLCAILFIYFLYPPFPSFENWSVHSWV